VHHGKKALKKVQAKLVNTTLPVLLISKVFGLLLARNSIETISTE